LVSPQEADEGVRFGRQAIEAGSDDPEALWMGGWGIFILAGEHLAGLSAIEQALVLNPNCALAWNFFGWAQSFRGRSASAIEAHQRAMRLSPLDPQRWLFYGGLAQAHFTASDYDQTI